MTIELIKRLLDACYEAKRIRDMLPPLPDGVTSSYIHFLDVIEQMEKIIQDDAATLVFGYPQTNMISSKKVKNADIKPCDYYWVTKSIVPAE